MKILGQYTNGNYNVTIYEDGTKVRENDLDFFESSFPENIDIKITNKCNMGCPMCHERSTPFGENADLLSLPFISSLRPFTELAIGGGNVFENPSFVPFLIELKKRKIIANITINQKHFEENFNLVRYLIKAKLVYGVGVSLATPSDSFVSRIKSCGPNVIIHVINGVVTKRHIERFLAHQDLKILFLGYKDFGRGEEYKIHYNDVIQANQMWTFTNLQSILSWFKVVSFDNLAIEQMRPDRFMSEKEFAEFYMGDEGQFTMYIDAVNREFGRNSISKVRYPISNNIEDMFKIVKEER